MWYVIQVTTGRERKVARAIRAHVARESAVRAKGGADSNARLALKECFVPGFMTERKFKGVWKPVWRALFPGYVIAVTSDVETLNSMLKTLPTFTKILGNSERFVPLDLAEQALIEAFTSEKHRTIAMSRGVYEGDHVLVLDGPLAGREALIEHVNRRKSQATITLDIMGRKVSTNIGLAIISSKG